jgi:hypothetical protein
MRMILSRGMRWARHGCINADKVLTGKFERCRPLVRRRYRWEDNYKMGWTGSE